MNKIPVALIGTGSIAASHVRAIQEQGDRAELVAVVDVDKPKADAFRDQHKVGQSFGSAAEMLEKVKPKLVHVATPPGTHCGLTVQALLAGAWVLCEKPLCGSLEELDRIEAAEKKSGAYCSSVFQWRFGSGGQHLKKLIQAGELGRPLVANCLTTWYRPPQYFEVPWRGKWATELGGPTLGHGIHAMDFLLWILGDWAEVQATAQTLDRAIEVEDVSMAMVQFENKAMASIVNSILSPREATYLRLDFQRVTVELRHLYGYSNKDWTFTAPRNKQVEPTDVVARCEAIGADIPSSHGTQLKHLLDSMEKGERPLVSGPEARRTIEFLTAIYKASLEKKPVKRGSIRPGDPFYSKVHGDFPEKRQKV